MDEALPTLIRLGFTLGGAWELTTDQINCALGDHGRHANVLYAFVIDSRVMYIGKTVRTLHSRMAGYKNPAPSQTTNVKNSRLIRESISAGKLVQIYTLRDNGLLQYGGFHLNLAAGLEDSLVRALTPPWNGAERVASDVFPSASRTAEIAGASSPVLPAVKHRIADQFRSALLALFEKARVAGKPAVDVNSGELHRIVGGYPGANHKMPVCCNVMQAAKYLSDVVVQSPPKGRGASLTIRYALPRPSGSG